MSDLTQRVIASAAETVVLISPHAPLESDKFVAYDGPQLYGDFAMFRAPTATVHAELDDELLNEMARVAAEQNLAMVRIKGFDLDHGTAVPLYFLQRNGWNGRVVALGYSFLSNEDHLRFGKCIKQAIENVGCCVDRKSTRLNSSHTVISYAVFCLKKKKKKKKNEIQDETE